MDIGYEIKRLRVTAGLTQEELAVRTELSKGFISQLENNLTSPSIASLTDILHCLGTDLKTFFTESDDPKVVFNRSDHFINDKPDIGCKTSWIVRSAKKLQMEPLLLTLDASGKTEEEAPHHGEEFGYVLKGQIDLILGNQIFTIKKGEAFYYEAGKTHQIINSSSKAAQVLWVCTPPNM